MVSIRSLFIGVAVFGCSNAAPVPSEPGGPSGADVRVVNGTHEPFAFFAIAADLAPVFDPIPEAPVEEPWVHVVAPGADWPVGDLSGGAEAPNGGVAVYLYALTSGGTRVHFSRVHLASGEQIRQAGGRIVVR
jgi:hypothetical protein